MSDNSANVNNASVSVIPAQSGLILDCYEEGNKDSDQGSSLNISDQPISKRYDSYNFQNYAVNGVEKPKYDSFNF